MLSSDLTAEIGTLIRSLERRVRQEPDLNREPVTPVPTEALDHIERAIVSLVVLHVVLRRAQEQ